jgi:3-hydroxyisobutyrate dehydrogenase-like beta-hydroxyacid dehydrogenase
MHRQHIGFAGLGMMGSLMAASLRRAGFPVSVWNRTVEKAERWAAEQGGSVAASPGELAASVDLVITMVVDGEQVRELLLGKGGVADGAASGLLCVDCSTIGRPATLSIARELAARGLRMVDAPVTGSTPAAREAKLTIMVGGAELDVVEARPALEAMSARVIWAGPLGDGQAIKVINNAVACANAVTVAEALIAASAGGLDLDALVAVMASGSGGSRMLDLKGPAMRAHDYEPLFRTAHMAKDVALCLDEAGRGLFRSAELALEDLRAAAQHGYAQADFAALIEAVQRRTGRVLEERRPDH